MNRVIQFLAICSLLAGWAALAPAATKIRAKGDRVCLRAAPDPEAEVVTQLAAGDSLQAQGSLDGEWVEVEIPPSADVWVYGELLRDGKVSAERVQVRSGPGINYRTLGKLDQGQSVAVRQTSGEWLSIAPPPGCTAWIFRKFVEPVPGTARPVVAPAPVPTPVTPVPAPPPAPRVTPSPATPVKVPPVTPAPEDRREPPPAPLPSPAPAATPRPVPVLPLPAPADRPPAETFPVEQPRLPVLAPPLLPTPADVKALTLDFPVELADEAMVPGRPQGVSVVKTGVLRPAGWVLNRPSRYRLVVRDDQGRAVTLCYVLGDESQYAAIDGSTIDVHGKEYWVQGVRYPLVIPEQIIRK